MKEELFNYSCSI